MSHSSQLLPELLTPVLAFPSQSPVTGASSSGAVTVLVTAMSLTRVQGDPGVGSGRRACPGPMLHHLRAEEVPEPCCIKQHLKSGRTAGESALPSAPRWPGVARFLLCLPTRQGSCLERIPGKVPGGTMGSPLCSRHVGGSTPSPPPSRVSPPHPLPGATVRLADVLHCV